MNMKTWWHAVLFIAALCCFVLGGAAVAGAASAPELSCQIGSTKYATIPDALVAVPDNTATTIKLLKACAVSGSCTLKNKNITFDLNGYNLVFSNSTNDNPALYLIKCTIKTTGSGLLGVTTTAGWNLALYAEDSNLMLNGNIKATGEGDCAVSVWNTHLTLTGSVTASGAGCTSLNAGDSSVVTITGNITASGGVPTSGGDASVGICTGGPGVKVTVAGSVTADGMAIENGNGYGDDQYATIHVTGNVTSRAGNGVVIYYYGTVTIDKSLSANKAYIIINGSGKKLTTAQSASSTTKAGYKTFTDGKNTVWVKEVNVYFYNGSSVTKRSVACGAKATAPSVKKTGYALAGWYTTKAKTGGTKFDATKAVTKSVTYYARWKSTDTTLKALKVSVGKSSVFANKTQLSNHSLSVGTTASSVAITPTKTNSYAKVQIYNGKSWVAASSKTLSMAKGKTYYVYIRIVAENGNVGKTYTVKVSRKK